MAFAFQRQQGVAGQVRSIAQDQVEKALAAAKQVSDFDATVHALRRRCKKLRGLLRLVQPHFKNFSDENKAVREAANMLGGARDALVMVETLDDLVGNPAGHGAALEAIAARQYLTLRLERLAAEGDQGRTLQAFSAVMGKLGSRIEDWRFEAQGFALIGDGLEQSYRQFRTLAADAQKHETAEMLHEWRKHTKYHGHHVALLSQTAPDMLRPLRHSIDALGDHLGDHHNLAVLGDTLGQSGLGDLKGIEQVIVVRQRALARSAFALGRQLVAERPVLMRQRFAQYFKLLPGEA